MHHSWAALTAEVHRQAAALLLLSAQLLIVLNQNAAVYWYMYVD
jgi:hypothetical protein